MPDILSDTVYRVVLLLRQKGHLYSHEQTPEKPNNYDVGCYENFE